MSSQAAVRLGVSSFAVARQAYDAKVWVPLSERMRAKIGDANLTAIQQELVGGVAKSDIQKRYTISEWALILIELDDPALPCVAMSARDISRRDSHRKIVLQFISATKDATRQTLHRQHSGTYEFMIAKDRDWFVDQLPAQKRSREVQRSRHERMSDPELATKVVEVAEALYGCSGRPRRVSGTRILRAAGMLRTYHQHIHRYPHTAHVLTRLSESKSQHLQRIVSWAIAILVSARKAVSVRSIHLTASEKRERILAIREYVRQCAVLSGAALHVKSSLSDSPES
jgi:Tn7-like transposition protein D